MLGFLKDKAVKLGSADLENYLRYLGQEVGVKQSEKSAGRLLSTIDHYMAEIAGGNTSTGKVAQHMTDYKNSVIQSKALTDHRDADFCEGYVLACFFTFLGAPELPAARERAALILRHMELHIDNELRSDPYSQKLLQACRNMFG